MKELTMAELSAGVRALVGRMESNPNEFYGEADKWRFMFSSNFRDVLTEPEKGALHEALKEVRRKEFDEKVMRELLKDQMENQLKSDIPIHLSITGAGGGGAGVASVYGGTGFGITQIKAEGATVGYDDTVDSLRYALNNPTTSLQIGKQTLSEEDIKRMKEASKSPSFFK
jgi:hypothetical protein